MERSRRYLPNSSGEDQGKAHGGSQGKVRGILDDRGFYCNWCTAFRGNHVSDLTEGRGIPRFIRIGVARGL
jgi:hypothetical protein